MSALSALHGAAHTLLSNFFYSLPVPQASGDMSQQTFIVTGSNVGLGLELSRHLLRLGVGKLIMAVRTESKGQAAKRQLLESTGRDDLDVEVWSLDMENYESVKAFCTRVNGLPRVDGICANAGMMTTNFSLSEGNEKTLTVNVIGVFLLFFLLLPKMREHERLTGRPCRFVIPNSALHYMAPLKELDPPADIFATLNDPKKADMAGRYPLTKLLVLWIVRELADKGAAMPIVNTPNPSFCQSELLRENKSAVVRFAAKLTARTTEQGSRVLYHGLMAGKEAHGQYLTNCHVQT